MYIYFLDWRILFCSQILVCYQILLSGQIYLHEFVNGKYFPLVMIFGLANHLQLSDLSLQMNFHLTINFFHPKNHCQMISTVSSQPSEVYIHSNILLGTYILFLVAFSLLGIGVFDLANWIEWFGCWIYLRSWIYLRCWIYLGCCISGVKYPLGV